MNPIHLACINGDTRVIEKITEVATNSSLCRRLLNQRDYRGRKPEQMISKSIANNIDAVFSTHGKIGPFNNF